MEESYVDENEAICDELARHYAQHGLKDPEGYFDSEDKEVQQILNQGFDTLGVDNSVEASRVKDTHRSVRSATTNIKMLNASDWSQDSASIERVSGPEELEDDVFLGYFAIDATEIDTTFLNATQ